MGAGVQIISFLAEKVKWIIVSAIGFLIIIRFGGKGIFKDGSVLDKPVQMNPRKTRKKKLIT